MTDRDYEVGFGRPPRRTRFAPGQSGNPSGKRKPRPTMAEILDRILAERVAVTEGGEKRKLTKEEVFLRQTVNKAIAGDRQFAALLLGYLSARGVAPNESETGAADAYLLDELQRMYPSTDDRA